MDRISNAFEGAFRRLGLKKAQYKKREVCFNVKAMGLVGMPVEGIKPENGQQAVAELVNIWSREDAVNVTIMISASKGLRIKDKKGRELFSYKIYNVANCTVDRENPDVFLFIARQRDGTNSCHAFFCNDKLQAEAICMSLSNAFQKAFEVWVRKNGLPSRFEESRQQENQQKEDLVAPVYQQEARSIDKNPTSDDNWNYIEQKEEIFLAPPANARRNFENGRKPSTTSETSVFSFNSQADDVFSTLLAVGEEDEAQVAPPWRRGSFHLETVEEKEKFMSLLDGEEVVWQQDDSEC